MRNLNDNYNITALKDNVALRLLADRFTKAWEKADTDNIDDMFVESPYIDFSIFERGMSLTELKAALKVRTRETTFERFDIFNYVCLFEKGIAQMSYEIEGELASDLTGTYDRLAFTGIIAASLVKTDEGWKFSSIRFELQDDDVIVWPQIKTNGIPQVKGRGDVSFAQNWKLHRDQVGWFSDSRLPSVTSEFDAPWYVIKNREYLGSDEEQIEETMYRYFYGIDMNAFDLYLSTFHEDAMIIYADGKPYNRREVIDFLKCERQGSPRCVHTGKFTKFEVNGDRAYCELYVRGTVINDQFPRGREYEERRLAWARYKLKFVKDKGQWWIDRINYYPAWFVAEG